MYNTVSLEVAKELFEIGWRKECGFFYFKEEIYTSELWDRRETNGEYIEAPQLHEILDSLPYKISIEAANVFFKMEIFEDDYRIGYYEFDQYPWGEQISENPHDAAAKLLIWCVKNNYVTL